MTRFDWILIFFNFFLAFGKPICYKFYAIECITEFQAFGSDRKPKTGRDEWPNRYSD